MVEAVTSNKKKTYVEIFEYATTQVVKRIDVTDKTARYVDRLERGMSINMNHNDFCYPRQGIRDSSGAHLTYSQETIIGICHTSSP